MAQPPHQNGQATGTEVRKLRCHCWRPQPEEIRVESKSNQEHLTRQGAANVTAGELVSFAGDYSHPPRRRRILLPITLFVATCASTFWSGATGWMPALYMDSFERAGEAILANWRDGLIYMAAVLGILLTHEMGHFLLAMRHKIPASLPFFIPVPFLPFGTMGAVIGLRGSRADRRQLFDIGIAGPLAGLIVAIPIIWLGIRQLEVLPPLEGSFRFHNPLLMRLMIEFMRPDYCTPDFFSLNQFNPLLMAGWVGLLVTGLNMLPISQLDGGHTAYALLGRRAHILARALLVAAILYILAAEQYKWVLMLVLVILMGADHPPTADDTHPLGWFRRTIGYLSLTIPIFCFASIDITGGP